MNKERKHVGVTQKAIVFKDDGRFLALRRSASALTHALRWDLPGGELEYEEDPRRGIEREILEETGLSVEKLTPFDVFGHTNPGGFWVTIAYLCTATGEKVRLSGEHDDFRWVTKEDFLTLESTDKNRQFVLNLK